MGACNACFRVAENIPMSQESYTATPSHDLDSPTDSDHSQTELVNNKFGDAMSSSARGSYTEERISIESVSELYISFHIV